MIRILLAEDMHMVRGALVALLELEPDFSVVAEIEDGRGVLSTARELRPDIALLDIGLPGISGLDAARALHEEVPNCRVVVLTALDAPGTVHRAIDAHVWGFLPKNAPPADLASAIRQVASGRRIIDSRIPATAWEPEPGRALPLRNGTPLTRRETDVLQLASEGNKVSEIAGTLHLSLGTVRNYLTAVVTKLQARNRLDAVRIAKEEGWIR
ncbi:DNA-binding response regulator [Streptomyces sp. NPDC101152]|uniref:response regulator transcription factor n=1 Tax=Streptomyces sp. NPDC101152 TaxID=3366116 RepID=UPI00381C0CFA